MLRPALVLAALLVAAACSHHAEHHARGEEHWHHAPYVDDVHDSDGAHRQDSHPDTFHGH